MNELIIVYIISSIIALLLLLLSIYKSKEVKTIYFSFFIFHIFIYSLGVAIEVSCTEILQATWGNTMEYLGICFVAPFLLLTVCEYIDYKIKSKLYLIALFIIPLISFLLVLTFPINGLFYKSFSLTNNMGIYYLDSESSIYRNILYIYFFVVVLLSIFLMVRTAKNDEGNLKQKSFFLIKGLIIPVIVIAFYLLGLTPYGIDVTPLALLFLSMYYGYNILFKESFYTTRFQRNYVIDNMRDGYLLIDSKNNYIDSNKIAKKIFPTLKKGEIGDKITFFEDLPKDIINNSEVNEILEFSTQNEKGENKFYNLQKSFLRRVKETDFSCWLIYDVTNEVEMKKSLEFMAKYDRFTKIYNRKSFYELGEDLFLENVKNKRNFSVFMLDIDFFKKVNDNYGHRIGDLVILNMVRIIKNNIREQDIFSRYGGEEFILFLEEIDLESSYKIAEKLRIAVEEDLLEVEGKKIKITISIGIGNYEREKDESLDDLIAKADKFLYEAKRTGRNKVVIQ